LLSGFERVRLLARTTVSTPKRIRETKRLLKKAFRYQMEGIGFSLIEILSACPTYWRLSPVESNKYIEQTMTDTYPLGIFRDVE
jgi:2-oxoglutarate ferredoxin oxidoreductase subunit beta